MEDAIISNSILSNGEENPLAPFNFCHKEKILKGKKGDSSFTISMGKGGLP